MEPVIFCSEIISQYVQEKKEGFLLQEEKFCHKNPH